MEMVLGAGWVGGGGGELGEWLSFALLLFTFGWCGVGRLYTQCLLFIPNNFSSVAFWTKSSNVYISERPKKMWKLNFLFSNLFDESLHIQKSCKHET